MTPERVVVRVVEARGHGEVAVGLIVRVNLVRNPVQAGRAIRWGREPPPHEDSRVRVVHDREVLESVAVRSPASK